MGLVNTLHSKQKVCLLYHPQIMQSYGIFQQRKGELVEQCVKTRLRFVKD